VHKQGIINLRFSLDLYQIKTNNNVQTMYVLSNTSEFVEAINTVDRINRNVLVPFTIPDSKIVFHSEELSRLKRAWAFLRKKIRQNNNSRNNSDNPPITLEIAISNETNTEELSTYLLAVTPVTVLPTPQTKAETISIPMPFIFILTRTRPKDAFSS
jgi:uncharacterized membrane protein